ncbi:hypothetical protein [Variovorax sp. OV329]|uniref:hypothetical protein n=1 Tax=Variovorax sp. OV329 TaxID=1882825 RepID=UPI0008E198C4|nr:hypothetical protein [Variovorax sp. OV329]SFM63801.1 hypothetical protein SAMN05444747_10795 [Variovorax sp. OV329]
MNRKLWKTRYLLSTLLASALFVSLAEEAMADRMVSGGTRTSVNRSASANVNRNVGATANTNVNRNVNANVNRNVNTNVNRNVNVDVDVDRNWHPVATAAVATAAVATTAAVIGSMTRTLPPACVPVQAGAVVYQQCGGVYYQPQYVGTAVQYVVVPAP